VAFVVPADGVAVDDAALLAELRSAARSSLADYKAPDRVVVTERLPLTSMMKVDKRALADQAALLAAPSPPAESAGATIPGADLPSPDRPQHRNGAHAS
jgi:acyl-coenzyme A synthetase/AMP-(fatty) acid ligase